MISIACVDSDEEDVDIVSYGQFRANVVGIQYYQGKVGSNEMVALHREPHNRYDRNAIRVDNIFGQQVGHIQRAQAAALALLVDKNHAKIEGMVHYGNNNKFSMPCVITLYGLPGNLEVCKNEMVKKGYPLTGNLNSDENTKRSSSKSKKSSYVARNTSTGKLHKLSQDEMKQELENLFTELDGNNEKNFETCEPSPCIITPLYDHQKHALTWMKWHENADELPPFWHKQGSSFHNSCIGFTTDERPSAIHGGLLADDMGIGKTLTVISLIVSNFRNGMPLVTIDGCDVASTDSQVIISAGDKKRKPKILEVNKPYEVLPALLSPHATVGSKRPKREPTKQPAYYVVDSDSDDEITMVTNTNENPVSSVIKRVEMQGVRATLIVCPLSVLSNWQDQIDAHVKEGTLNVYSYYGHERSTNANMLSQQDVVLTTYQTLSSDFKRSSPLHQIKWLRVVLDEGHYIRNVSSIQSKACLALQAERRWVVTGTPLQNSIKDLYALVSFLRVEPFAKKEWWNRTIQRPIGNGDSTALKRLQLLMSTLSLRRSKSQEVDGKKIINLPNKVCYIQHVILSSEERKLYDTFLEEGRTILERYARENCLLENYAHVLVVLMRLRQLCCHPKLCSQIVDFITKNPISTEHSSERIEKLRQVLAVLLSSGDEECPICLDSLNQPVITHCAHLFCRQCIEDVIRADKPICPLCRSNVSKKMLVEPVVESKRNNVVEKTWSSSAKVDGLLTLLRKEAAEDILRKHLVVSQFSSFLDLIEKPLDESGFRFVRLDGSMSKRQRADVIARFSESTSSAPTVMLLSLKAGGVGINLTAASRVFLMDPAWNPALEEQCFDRCHRLGQTEEVKVFKFIVKDSVEERMLKLQEEKRKLMSRAFGKKQIAKDKQKQRLIDAQHLLS